MRLRIDMGGIRSAGFTLIEVVIIVGILAVLSGVGVVAYTALHGAPGRSAVPSADAVAAQSTVQAFYAAYTNSQGKGAEILQQYGSPALLEASKTGTRNFSPIVCGQNVAPPSTSTPTYTDGHYNVPVTLKFTTPLSFTAEVIKVGTEFKIDKVDCPAPKAGE